MIPKKGKGAVPSAPPKPYSQSEHTTGPRNLQEFAASFGGMRRDYAAMERHHARAGLEFDWSRIAFLKARRRFIQAITEAPHD